MQRLLPSGCSGSRGSRAGLASPGALVLCGMCCALPVLLAYLLIRHKVGRWLEYRQLARLASRRSRHRRAGSVTLLAAPKIELAAEPRAVVRAHAPGRATALPCAAPDRAAGPYRCADRPSPYSLGKSRRHDLVQRPDRQLRPSQTMEGPTPSRSCWPKDRCRSATPRPTRQDRATSYIDAWMTARQAVRHLGQLAGLVKTRPGISSARPLRRGCSTRSGFPGTSRTWSPAPMPTSSASTSSARVAQPGRSNTKAGSSSIPATKTPAG